MSLPFGIGNASAADWGASLGFASDNVYRGVSLTAGRPAWLADLHRTIDVNWVVGISASAARPVQQAAGAEFVPYVQRNWHFDDDWALQVGISHHETRSNGWRNGSRYDDVTLAFGYRGRWHASLSASPDFRGYYPAYYPGYRPRATTAAWIETGLDQPLSGRLSANLGVGYADFVDHSIGNYGYGNAGLRYGVGDAYLYFSYLWTSPIKPALGRSSNARSRWVATLVFRY